MARSKPYLYKASDWNGLSEAETLDKRRPRNGGPGLHHRWRGGVRVVTAPAIHPVALDINRPKAPRSRSAKAKPIPQIKYRPAGVDRSKYVPAGPRCNTQGKR